MILGTLTCIHQACYQKAVFTYPVGALAAGLEQSFNSVLVQGVAKVAKSLGIDYAEAVVSGQGLRECG